MVFKIYEGISCSSISVKELDVIVFVIKIISLYNPIKFLVTLYPTSLANLVVEVGTRHSHQILLQTTKTTYIDLPLPHSMTKIPWPHIQKNNLTNSTMHLSHIQQWITLEMKCEMSIAIHYQCLYIMELLVFLLFAY